MDHAYYHRRRTAVGASPGAIAPPPTHVPPRVRLMSWDAEVLEEREVPLAEVAGVHSVSGRLTWIDVQGLGDGTCVSDLGEALGLHPLAVADVVNVGQRPKAERYGDALFVVLRMASLVDGEHCRFEQVSIFLLDGLVLTFQEQHGDCLDSLRDRIRGEGRRLREGDATYLATMVIDAVVDGYFPVLEGFGEHLEDLEAQVVDEPSSDLLERVYRAKRELLAFRRAVWPLRETLAHLLRDDENLPAHVMPYLRDAADHVAQVADIVETYREVAGSFVDVYLSSVSQRTNDTMRVLTVSATIFIPLTFVAGVYGMNFDTSRPGNMPELSLPYGYAVFWVVCVALGAGMLLLFRRLGWLGGLTRGSSG